MNCSHFPVLLPHSPHPREGVRYHGSEVEIVGLPLRLLLLVPAPICVNRSSMIFDGGFDPNRKYLYAQYPHGV